MIIFADRGLVVNGKPFIKLFNVNTYISCSIIIVYNDQLHQVLCLTSCVVFITINLANYPLSYRMLPGYPFNSLLGQLCSGRGLQVAQHSNGQRVGCSADYVLKHFMVTCSIL